MIRDVYVNNFMRARIIGIGEIIFDSLRRRITRQAKKRMGYTIRWNCFIGDFITELFPQYLVRATAFKKSVSDE